MYTTGHGRLGRAGYNLDDIPYPPGGTDTTGSCRTRTGTINDAVSTQGIPLTPVPFATADPGNNRNTSVWSGGAGDQNSGWMLDGNGKQWGIPTDGEVGYTVTGQLMYPVFNNLGGYTPEKCEVDACNEHVGQGGGQPHLHGDPFGPTCLYSASNYSSLTVHPPLIGFAQDGYWIYGRHLSTSAVGYSTTLDVCGGHQHGDYTYHYHTQVVNVTSGSSGANVGAPGVPSGYSYPATTTGPYYCFKGNLTAADKYFGRTTNPKKVSHCSGMTNYYVKDSNVNLKDAGTQATSTVYSCSAGYYNSNYGTTVSSCVICAADTYSSAGATSCTACASGYSSIAGASSCTESTKATGSFSLSALPTTAFSGSTLTTAAVTSLTSALSTALKSASSTTAITVSITKVTETSTSTILYSSSRRLTYGALTVAYSVSGSSSAVSAVTSTTATSLQTAITSAVSSISGYSGVSSTVSSSATTTTTTTTGTGTTATSSSTTNAIIGGVVGGVGGLVLIAAGAYFWQKTKGKSSPVSSEPATIVVTQRVGVNTA